MNKGSQLNTESGSEMDKGFQLNKESVVSRTDLLNKGSQLNRGLR